jgi:hypothetical protein
MAMLRRILGTLLMLAVVGTAQEAAGQEGFTVGHTDVGPTVGLGGIGSASLAIGGRLERGWRAMPDLGDGIVGLQIGADYYSWSVGSSSWSYIPIGATANYHFVLENRKIDPFLGLGLGYSIVSCNFDGFGGTDLCANSAIYFIGRAGGRYFFSDRMAAYADAGAGAATLNVGLMFKLQ